MPVMNLAALGIGLATAQLLWFLRGLHGGLVEATLLAAGLALPLTALFGPEADGVARWLVVAGVTIQPALILVPVLVTGLASQATNARVAAIALASAGVALQPDAGSAAMLVLGLAAAAIARPSARTALAFLLAMAGGAFALEQPVNLPPVPFVEGVFATALQSGVAATLLLLAGVLLLFLPALLMRTRSPGVAAAFAGVWAGGFVAAVFGPYPTPVLGFGGSAVLGYLASVSLLTIHSVAEQRSSAPAPRRDDPAIDCQSHELA